MTSLITAVTRAQGLGISLGYCQYDNQNFDSRLHVLSWETKKIYNVSTKRISQLLNLPPTYVLMACPWQLKILMTALTTQ